MKSMQHPNIVQLHDILACDASLPGLLHENHHSESARAYPSIRGVSSDPPYLCIVMEYVADSEPLSYVIRRSSLSRPAVLSILRWMHAPAYDLQSPC
eukprot:5757600-Amphidinium_carterae.1